MSTQRINAAEKDLEKFIKFLVLKSTQVVVQSRLGEKIKTPCNPLATGDDWFNIVVQDHPEVNAETKRALALEPGQSIVQRLPLCVEISLKTVDGDQMVLEVWSIDLQGAAAAAQRLYSKERDEKTETGGGKSAPNGGSTTANTALTEQQTLKAAHAIYNRMGQMLKSLITLTRATPAYKLSRRQNADSYRIYYRIYVDRPQVHTLGEGYRNVRIGQLNTIIGQLSMAVAYRTKMTITPTAAQAHNGDTNAIMLKSDHFRPSDASPMQPLATAALKKGQPIANGERKVVDIEKPLRPGAFTDVGKLRQFTENDFVLPETPPFEWLLRRARHESGGSSGSIESLNRKSDAASPLGNGHQHNINNNLSNHNNNMLNYNNNTAAFKSLENDENSQQLQAQPPQQQQPQQQPQSQQKSPAQSTLSQSPIKSLLIPTPPVTRNSATPPASADEDHLMRELNFPFASPTSHVNDLAKFYRDCYHAPPLRGLSELQTDAASGSCGAAAITTASSPDSSAAVDDLSRQLEQFETSLEDYDKLVSQLGLSTSSSTGSRSSGGLQMSN